MVIEFAFLGLSLISPLQTLNLFLKKKSQIVCVLIGLDSCVSSSSENKKSFFMVMSRNMMNLFGLFIE